MKNKVLLCLLSLALMVVFSASPLLAAEVSQGKCVAVDTENNVITIEEYDTNFSTEFPYGKPTGVQSVFNVAKAQIGMKPEPGDILRLAYVVKGTDKVAIKVMNVSKQDLRKK